MAAIQEKVKNNKIVSFRFRAYLGKDENGKKLFDSMTWYPEEGLTKAKSRKAAAAAATLWKKEVKAAYALEQTKREKEAAEKAEQESVLTFGRFVREVWLPLAVNDGQHRPSTVAMYTHILALILPRLGDIPLQEVTGLQITSYLWWLRNEYRTYYNKPLADKTIKHHYNILRIAFNYLRL